MTLATVNGYSETHDNCEIVEQFGKSQTLKIGLSLEAVRISLHESRKSSSGGIGCCTAERVLPLWWFDSSVRTSKDVFSPMI
jgi:hypothetical protein